MFKKILIANRGGDAREACGDSNCMARAARAGDVDAGAPNV
ncbi:hypothetical protein [Roseateles aquatilis]|nr:hypothetical protein [Roseateles aquatilis]